ncbi:hypothetical protein MKX08_001874 [Trichoderma sp. CBMAI-0020]|nr:hypothetical protein MKX08_001874 [Trichoderma sp. CBMAI-0020]
MSLDHPSVLLEDELNGDQDGKAKEEENQPNGSTTVNRKQGKGHVDEEETNNDARSSAGHDGEKTKEKESKRPAASEAKEGATDAISPNQAQTNRATEICCYCQAQAH